MVLHSNVPDTSERLYINISVIFCYILPYSDTVSTMVFDSILSPLAPFADVCLEVKETEVFGFRGLVLSVLICLSLSLIVELGKQIDQHKKEIV